MNHIFRIQPKSFLRGGIFLLILLGIGIFMTFIPFRHELKVTTTGYQTLATSDAEGRTVKVTIEGTYITQLLRDDRFQGTIQVEGYSVTEGELSLVVMDQQEGALLTYEDSDGKKTVFGRIFFDDNFSQFAIMVFEDGTNSWNQGTFIGAMALNRGSAMLIGQTAFSDWEKKHGEISWGQ